MDLPIPATIHLKCGVSLDVIVNIRLEEGSYFFLGGLTLLKREHDYDG